MIMKKKLRILLLLSLILVVPACGIVKTLYATSSKFDAHEPQDPPEPVSAPLAIITAQKFGLMALFAGVAYREDLKKSVRDTEACNYISSSIVNDYGMPHMDDGSGRWLRWKPDQSIPACVNEEGLFYETYVFENSARQVLQAVIAFRGTENTGSQFFKDWGANLTAAIGWEPKQYEIARHRLPLVIAALRQQYPAAQIFTVGHSLGGGLAQQLGYQSEEIEEVYTFNTSPVTNWTSLRMARQVNNDYPTIYRVYHGGEILEKVRFVTTSFTATRYGRYDLGIQFGPRDNIKGHSMLIMACGLAEIIAKAPDGTGMPAHHYDRAYAQDSVFNGEICSDYQEQAERLGLL